MSELIYIKTPEGKIDRIDKSQLDQALKEGYTTPQDSEVQKALSIEDASLLGGLAERAASAATLGGSRYLEQAVGDAFKTDVFSQESQKNRSEKVERDAPLTGTAFEVGGMLAPILLTGGAAAPEVAAVQTAGKVGKTALTISDAFNPVGAIAKLGAATTEQVAPVIAKSVAGLAETSPRIANAITKGGSLATGGALEGAAFGVGNALDEHALGSEQSLGEAMLHHAGIGAILGGGIGGAIGGLGGVFGKLEKATERAKQSVKPNDILESIGDAPKTLDEALINSAEDEVKKKGFIAGLQEFKPHAKQLVKDSDELGLPTFPNQLSKSRDVQIGFEAISKSPSLVGNSVRKQIGEAWEKLANLVNPIFETGEIRTALQIGEDLQAKLLKKADDMIESYKAKYQELGLTEKVIPVSEKTTARVAKNLNKLTDIKDGHAPSEVYQIIKLLDRADNTLENITGMQKTLNAYIYNPLNDANKKRIAGYVKGRVDAIYENTIKKQFSRKDQKELFKLYKDARKEFAQTIEHFSDVSGATGKSKIRSPLSFVEHFKNNINAESLVKKLFKKDNFRFVESFKEKFPQEFEMIKNFQKKNMMVLKDQTLDSKATLKNIKNLSPEMRGILFTPKELNTLEKSVNWIESFPPEFNPSRSGSMVEWTMGSVPFVLKNIEDAVKMAGIKGVQASAHDSPKSIISSKLAKITSNINNSVKETSRFILDKGSKYAVPASSVFNQNDDADEETIEKIKKAYEDVSGLNDSMTKGTSMISQYAPSTTNGFKTKSAVTLGHLYSKIPKYDSSLLNKKHKPSKSEMYKFNIHFRTVKDPFKVMKKVKFGAILPEEMETLKVVYPDLLEKTQIAVLNDLHSIIENDTLSYQNKIGLSSLLEKPLVDSLKPQNIAMNQMKTGNQQEAEAQKTNFKNLDLDQSYKTSFQNSAEDNA